MPTVAQKAKIFRRFGHACRHCKQEYRVRIQVDLYVIHWAACPHCEKINYYDNRKGRLEQIARKTGESKHQKIVKDRDDRDLALEKLAPTPEKYDEPVSFLGLNWPILTGSVALLSLLSIFILIVNSNNDFESFFSMIESAISSPFKQNKSAKPLPFVAFQNNHWNNLAHFLAGLPKKTPKKFHRSENLPAYHQHAKFMDSYWNHTKKTSITPMQLWRNRHLPDLYEKNTAFYPMSGSDFVNLYTLYPRARRYIMLALERPGEARDLEKIQPEQAILGLASLRAVLTNLYRHNYLKSNTLRRYTNDRHLTGVLPLILIVAVRHGLTVKEVQQIGLDSGGEVVIMDQRENRKTPRVEIPGIRIKFYAPEDIEPREILYFRFRLDSKAVDDKISRGRFLGRIKKMNTMMKAAVYLLHWPTLSSVNSFILGRSDIIIQDDSGIPYRFFDKEIWKVMFFGNYRPVALRGAPYSDTVQTDLDTDFKRLAVKLPFPYGYGVYRGKGKSNLILAIKNLHLPVAKSEADKK